MKNDLTSEEIKYIIARVLDNANDAMELIVREQDLKEFGLDIDLLNRIV